jgi:pimeloyl-ACP methyl ester carboxylesterase
MTLAPVSSSVSVLRAEGFRRMAFVSWERDAAAPAAICVHGLTRNGRDFDPLAEVLSHHRRVFCPDVLGRGKSDLLTNPKLVLNDVGPVIPREAMARIRDYVGYDPVFKDLAALEAHLRKVHAPFGPLTDGQWADMARHGHWRTAEGDYKLSCDPAIAAFIKQGDKAEEVRFWELWDAISCPVLVVRGARSDLLTAETVAEMKTRGPGCDVVEVPEVGHAPALMEPEQIAPIVDFLTA